MKDACDLHGFKPCNGPTEDRLYTEGNAYLDADFPNLDKIFSVNILISDTSEVVHSSMQQDYILGSTCSFIIGPCLLLSALILTWVALQRGGTLSGVAESGIQLDQELQVGIPDVTLI